jgi:hypothetical protein
MGWLQERGIEAFEVLQVLNAQRRWLRPYRDDLGRSVLTVTGRTTTGRVLRVALRPAGGRDWEILIAKELQDPDLAEYLEWEAGRG